MGWASGTELFDKLLKIFFNPKITKFDTILKNMIIAFEDADWDCQNESQYWDTPTVQKAFRELHPEWFEDE